jgi:hypothetical protein
VINESVGIQIGALGAIAPSRKNDLAELAFSAMITGTFSILKMYLYCLKLGTAATWLCACMAGAII